MKVPSKIRKKFFHPGCFILVQNLRTLKILRKILKILMCFLYTLEKFQNFFWHILLHPIFWLTGEVRDV